MSSNVSFSPHKVKDTTAEYAHAVHAHHYRYDICNLYISLKCYIANSAKYKVTLYSSKKWNHNIDVSTIAQTMSSFIKSLVTIIW